MQLQSSELRTALAADLLAKGYVPMDTKCRHCPRDIEHLAVANGQSIGTCECGGRVLVTMHEGFVCGLEWSPQAVYNYVCSLNSRRTR